MTFSYSGIVNYGKVTLPSVESWGQNNNILRDPPRSITTRRIDKVTDTSMLDQEIDKSSERVAESIRVYPRGANVMVGVSYNNQGSKFGNQQAKLPYRVMKDGVFRPPILRPVNLYPLSRLPRNNTTVDPIAYTADFAKKIMCPGSAKDYRAVKDHLLQVETTAAKGLPIRKPSEIGVAQNIVGTKIHYDTQTMKTQRIERPVEVGVRQALQTPLNAEAFSNIKYFAHTNDQTKKYTDHAVHNDVLRGSSRTNPSQKRSVQVVDSKISYHANPRVHAQAQSNIKSNVTKHVLHEYREARVKPELRGEIHVNTSGSRLYNAAQTIRPTATNYHLPQKPQKGGQLTNPAIPTFDRTWGNPTPKLKSNSFHALMVKNNQ